MFLIDVKEQNTRSSYKFKQLKAKTNVRDNFSKDTVSVKGSKFLKNTKKENISKKESI